VWLFILAPLVGGAIAAVAAPLLTQTTSRDEALISA
jgi:hypothetical protein